MYSILSAWNALRNWTMWEILCIVLLMPNRKRENLQNIEKSPIQANKQTYNIPMNMCVCAFVYTSGLHNAIGFLAKSCWCELNNQTLKWTNICLSHIFWMTSTPKYIIVWTNHFFTSFTAPFHSPSLYLRNSHRSQRKRWSSAIWHQSTTIVMSVILWVAKKKQTRDAVDAKMMTNGFI